MGRAQGVALCLLAMLAVLTACAAPDCGRTVDLALTGGRTQRVLYLAPPAPRG